MKKLVTATMLAALAASAQAQDVKIYGIFDASEYHVNNKGSNGSYTGFNSKAASTSRFGISATEDLGGGLKAGANIETELNVGSGATGSTSTGTAAGTFNRAANVFLSDQTLGTLTLGRQATPVYAAVGTGDALGVNSLGFINAVVGAQNNANPITGETRAPVAGPMTGGVVETIPGLFNAGIGYKSPTWAGFSVSAFSTPNSGAKDASFSDAGQRDIVVNYNEGALNVAAGQSKTFSATGNSFATKNLLAANYTVGALKVSGGLFQVRYDTLHDVDVKSLGARYQLNPKVSFGASWTAAEDKTVTANKNTTVGAGGFYDLSKRTQAYVLAGRSKNEGAAFLNAVYGGPTLAAASEGMVYTVGLKHSF